MNQSEPDYRIYNLKQLYDIRQHLDQRRFPTRYAALIQEIERKEAMPPEELAARNYPPSNLLQFFGAKPSREVYEPNNVLKAVRLLVDLEIGFFGVVLALPMLFIPGYFLAVILLGFVLYALFFSGVAILQKSLGTLRDEHSVELWSLVALGLSPLTAILYTGLAVYINVQIPGYEQIKGVTTFLSPFVGFFTPYILTVYWVKYICREDEF